MMAASNAARVGEAHLQVEPVPTEQNVVELESIRRSRKAQKIDRWFAVILIVAVSLFAGTFAMWTLNPAIKTLATSVQQWTPEGP